MAADAASVLRTTSAGPGQHHPPRLPPAAMARPQCPSVSALQGTPPWSWKAGVACAPNAGRCHATTGAVFSCSRGGGAFPGMPISELMHHGGFSSTSRREGRLPLYLEHDSPVSRRRKRRAVVYLREFGRSRSTGQANRCRGRDAAARPPNQPASHLFRTDR